MTENFLQKNKEVIMFTITFIMMVTLLIITPMSPAVKLIKSMLNAELGVVDYLKSNEEGNDFIILGEEVNVLVGYGGYMAISPRVNNMLNVTGKETINFINGTAQYYYDYFKENNVKYIYDSPINESIKGQRKWNVKNMKHLINVASESDLFELVYDKDNARLWKVK